jgi:1-acyl-sn-glycerol-3-phosphate acyltransferase
MILKASHNPFLYGFFSLYTRIMMRTSFRDISINGDVTDKGLPVLVIANHFSWWDGFWIMYANMLMFKRKFWFMMLEEQLRKHMFFNRTGGYSVKRGSRSIIETINYTIELLNDKRNLVLVFPQGKIESAYQTGFTFEKGIWKILNGVRGNAQIILAVNLIEYTSHKKPSVYIYITEYGDYLGDIENAYNVFYTDTLKKHIEKVRAE